MIVQILNYLSCLDLNYELQVEIKFRWSGLKFVNKLLTCWIKGIITFSSRKICANVKVLLNKLTDNAMRIVAIFIST